jgi:ATP-dependent exoDNAse (exonuclease V) alpha subunit
VDTVLLADSGSTAATNANQWYVAISRGRKRVEVFTEDKTALRTNIQRLGERELAADLLAEEHARRRRRHYEQARRYGEFRRINHAHSQRIAM